MFTRPHHLLQLLITLLLYACTGAGSDKAVPRPTANPRIEMPDSSYVEVYADALKLTVNKAANTEISSSGSAKWINVRYPIFASPTIYLTLTRCEGMDMQEILSNRREREALNLGGQTYELTELSTPQGWQCTMSVARGSMTTPIQILAHDDTRVLSGALVINLPDSLSSSGPEVIAPVINAIEHDMIILLSRLSNAR